ncbi:MAG: type II toxin-antitoxin system Phd/YefM family antitoxin [Nitrospirae bacterium]|nr:type II toxin-antitoxin system Phd/YefM family antitoxin [Nitrospirota bacterium]
MSKAVSKSQFKPRSLEFFRRVQETGEELIITDRGKPVLKLVPYHEEPDLAMARLRNSVVSYRDPLEPVAANEWEALS